MNVLTVVTALAAVASVAIAGFALAHAIRTFARGAELQAFLVLTERYERIMSTLPSHARVGQWGDTDQDFAIRLQYMNLCAEEFYLRERRMLSADVWGIWSEEMCATLASPPYADAWLKLESEFASYPEFADFVREAMARNQSPVP